jgi:hypothetical protein
MMYPEKRFRERSAISIAHYYELLFVSFNFEAGKQYFASFL